jgi:hypothetical protein
VFTNLSRDHIEYHGDRSTISPQGASHDAPSQRRGDLDIAIRERAPRQVTAGARRFSFARDRSEIPEDCRALCSSSSVANPES